VLPKPIDTSALLASLLRAGVVPGVPGSVLVVDDDHASLKLMSMTLTQLGYRAACAADGEVALQAISSALPIAIVLDLMMPRMDGFEFLERLRAAPERRRIPVIVWTVKD